MAERDRLIEEFNLIWKKNPIAFYKNLAEWIIEDRKRIVAPLIKVEYEIRVIVETDGERRRWSQLFNKRRKEAIDKTLKNVGG